MPSVGWPQLAVGKLTVRRLADGSGALGGFLKRRLILRRRILIGQARQQLAHAAHVDGDVLDAVDDAAAAKIDEHDIAVLAHDLKDQLFGNRKAQLVERLEGNFQNTFAALLADLDDARALNMLAQQHAKRERGRRVWQAFLDEMDTRCRRIDGGVKLHVALPGVYIEDQLVSFRLVNLVDFARGQPLRQLAGDGHGHDAVICHN